MTRLLLAIITLIAVWSNVSTVNAAPIDPTDGILSHLFVDREAEVITGMISVLNRDTRQYESFGFAIDITDTLTLESVHVDVYTHTAELISFSRSNVTYNGWIVDPMEYIGTLSDKFYRVYEDGSHCNLFHLTINETNEVFTVCLDSTDAPNADNGLVSVNFKTPVAGNPFWSGVLAQTINGQNYQFNFMITEDTIPTGETHKIFIPMASN